MVYLLTFVHIIVCLILVLVVLLQTGKRADLAGAFGGGGSQTAFGARGAATFLSKATTIAAIVFMLTSLALSIISSRPGTSSVLDKVPSAPAPMAPLDTSKKLPETSGQPQPPAPPAQAPSGSTAPAPTSSAPVTQPTAPAQQSQTPAPAQTPAQGR